MENWTGTAVGIMHCHKIKQRDLAAVIGWTHQYLCQVLSGKVAPAGAEQKVMSAINSMIENRVTQELSRKQDNRR